MALPPVAAGAPYSAFVRCSSAADWTRSLSVREPGSNRRERPELRWVTPEDAVGRLCQAEHVLVVGVDACKSGWVAVVLRHGATAEAHYLPVIDSLESVAPNADAVAIDIPIGLPSSGRREADVQAREFLGQRRNSVFFAPVRKALTAPTHALATQAASDLTGSGISRQAYALGRKILEVEAWLPSSSSPVYEMHPEVSFAVLLGAPALAPKKTWAGMVERRRGLEAKGISLDQFGNDAALRASVDDMLDATVGAWTARRLAQGAARSFPEPPPLDTSGRQVAIWA